MVIRFYFVFLGKGVINFKHFKARSQKMGNVQEAPIDWQHMAFIEAI